MKTSGGCAQRSMRPAFPTTCTTHSRRIAMRRCSTSCARTGAAASTPAPRRRSSIALGHGFRESEISFTGHAVSDSDLAVLQAHPGVHVNCDAISTIRRLGRRCPGRAIGIRLNPGLGAGYNERLRYAGEKPTKFGVYPDRFEEAIAAARSAGMRVDTLHFHIGSGYQGDALDVLDRVLQGAAGILDAHPEIRRLNVGGGLGCGWQNPTPASISAGGPASSRAMPCREACGSRWSRATMSSRTPASCWCRSIPSKTSPARVSSASMRASGS